MGDLRHVARARAAVGEGAWEVIDFIYLFLINSTGRAGKGHVACSFGAFWVATPSNGCYIARCLFM